MITKLIDAFTKVAAAKPLKTQNISRQYPKIVGDSLKMRKRINQLFPETLGEHLDRNEVPSSAIERVPSEKLNQPFANELIKHPGQDITEDSEPFGELNTGHLPRRLLGRYLSNMRRLNKTLGSQIIENPKSVNLFTRAAFNQKFPIDVTQKDIFDAANLARAGSRVADRKYGFDNYRSGVRSAMYKIIKSHGMKPTARHMQSTTGGLSDVPAPRNSGSDIPGRIPAAKAARAEAYKPDWGYRVYGDNS